MSRVYLTATLSHNSLGLALPTLSIATSDHTGGGYSVGGLHPSSLAALTGRGPEVKKGERFDVKVNCNKQRSSLSLVVATGKHLPHLEWSSDGGLGKLPGGLSAVVPLLLGGGLSPFLSKKDDKKYIRSDSKGSSRRAPSSSKSTSSRGSSSRSSSSRNSNYGEKSHKRPMAIEGVPVEKGSERGSKSRGPSNSRRVYEESELEDDSTYRENYQYERRSQPRSKDVRFRR